MLPNLLKSLWRYLVAVPANVTERGMRHAELAEKPVMSVEAGVSLRPQRA